MADNYDNNYNDLERDVNSLRADITKIMTNHLPHIQVAITKLNGKVGKLGVKLDERTKAISDRVVAGVTVNIILMIAGVVGIILLIN